MAHDRTRETGVCTFAFRKYDRTGRKTAKKIAVTHENYITHKKERGNLMPIIESRLDTDFYQFTMGQFLFRRYRNVQSIDRFINRTKSVPLHEIISESKLRQELDVLQHVQFKTDELDYLAQYQTESGKFIFREDYLKFLETLVLPNYVLTFTRDGIKLEFPGPLAETTYWETPALAIINESYTKACVESLSKTMHEVIQRQKMSRIWHKIATLQTHSNIIFSDFGTRRRFSQWWHEYVVRMLARHLSPAQFVGTSNVWLAKKYGLKPIGTMAHRLFMAMSGIVPQDDISIRASHSRVLQEWWDEYGHDLSIALLDTFGSFGLKNFTVEQAQNWKGIRIDSGDPFAEGDAVIAMYESFGIDPRTKILAPSDGLTIETMISLADYFTDRIKVNFGWGTSLTNDCGIPPLSLVVKLAEACGNEVIKLSNNAAKATGSPERKEQMMYIFGYSSTFNQECKY